MKRRIRDAIGTLPARFAHLVAIGLLTAVSSKFINAKTSSVPTCSR
jgi:hypothetical protein